MEATVVALVELNTKVDVPGVSVPFWVKAVPLPVRVMVLDPGSKVP